eukprot:GHVL01016184.1.p1 GENE.GHVL01016184.1~~GHVL01016184.1.p1  ORF type:complete len:2251 (+),score=411.05 GHVL01016184.1:38-6790(+)
MDVLQNPIVMGLVKQQVMQAAADPKKDEKEVKNAKAAKGMFGMCCAGGASEAELNLDVIAERQIGPERYLRLCIQSATNLSPADGSTSDPFVDVMFEGQNHKTSVINKNLAPVWDDTWEVAMKEPESDIIMKVFDKDTLTADDLLGCVKVRVTNNLSGIRREVLPLDKIPGTWFGKKPDSRLSILYQIVSTLENQPDLAQLQQAAASTDGPSEYTLQVYIYELKSIRDIIPAYGYVTVDLTVTVDSEIQVITRTSDIFDIENLHTCKFFKKDANTGVADPFLAVFHFEATGEQILLTKVAIKFYVSTSNFDNKKKAEKKNKVVEVDPMHVEVVGERRASDARQNEKKVPMTERLGKMSKKKAGDDSAPFILNGCWEETLDEIRDNVQSSNSPWVVWTQLTDKGLKKGQILTQIDLFAEEEEDHEDLTYEAITEFDEPPPLARGLAYFSMLAAQDVQKRPTRTYHLYAYADFLPEMDSSPFWVSGVRSPNRSCDPFLRIITGAGTKDLPRISNQQRGVLWDPPVSIQVEAKKRVNIRLQLFDDDSLTPFMRAEEMVGEHRVFTIDDDEMKWFHLYGGSINPKRKDVALNMCMGGIFPPSTYRGSLLVSFDTKKKAKKPGWPPRPELGYYPGAKPMKLEMRLFRGLYLLDEKFRDKEVDVLVQVAGCGLPFLAPKQKKKSDKMDKIQELNYDVLSFPGRVDKRGILRFHEFGISRDKAMQNPTFRHQLTQKDYYHRKRDWYKEEGGIFSEIDLSGGNQLRADPVAWVQRTTPPLNILPNVEWAYIYIKLTEDKSDSPPMIFGRFPLIKEFIKEEDNVKATSKQKEQVLSRKTSVELECIEGRLGMPSGGMTTAAAEWIELIWDESAVSELPEARITTRTAGTMLGFAVLKEVKLSKEVEEAKLRLLTGDDVAVKDVKELFKAPLPELDPYVADEYTEFDVNDPQNADLFQNPWDPWCLGMAHANVRKGSPGFLVQFEREAPALLETVYLHVDLLQARNLPSMDDDGALNPHFDIFVEDRVIKSTLLPKKELPKSLNPTYLRRMVVPVQLYMPPKSGSGYDDKRSKRQTLHSTCLPSNDDIALPLPPVFISIKDRDKNWGFVSYPLVGLAVEWKPNNLDDYPFTDTGEYRLSDANLDCGSSHIAKWYTLYDNDKAVPFSQEHKKKRSKGWTSKPKIALAIGYSKQVTSNGAYLIEESKKMGGSSNVHSVPDDKLIIASIEAQLYRFFEFEFALLGLRALNKGGSLPAPGWNVMMRCFWRNTTNPEIDDDSSFPCISFKYDEPKAVRNKFKELNKSKTDEDFGIDDYIGQRILSPVYKTPFLRYLQTKGQPERVILPDVLFRVMSIPEIIWKEASLSLSLQDYLHVTCPIAERKTEMQKSLQRIKNVIHGASVYEVDVDVHAEHDGVLLYDDDLVLGRYVLDQDLFFIFDIDETKHTQFFNAEDFFLNNPSKMAAVFTAPLLVNENVSDVGEGWGVDMLAPLTKTKTNEKKEKVEKIEKVDKKEVEKIEKVDKKDKKEVRSELRTFMRNIGWEVSPLKKRSNVLCRLRMYERFMKGDKTHEFPTWNIVQIHVTHDIEANVIWANPRTRFCHPGDLEKRSIMEELEEKKKALEKTDDKKHQSQQQKRKSTLLRNEAKLEELQATMAEEEHEHVADSVESRPGYKFAIPVHKGDFVVRLKKRLVNYFDRVQCHDWLKAMECDSVLNLNTNLIRGHDNTVAGKIKGNIKIYSLDKKEADSETDKTAIIKNEEDPEMKYDPKQDAIVSLPVDLQWVPMEVAVHIYILNARDLTNVDLIGHSDPYIQVQLGTQNCVNMEHHLDGDLDPDFYWHVMLSAQLPGEGRLCIRVMDKGALSDTIMGSVNLDIEDRWMALQRRKVSSIEEASILPRKLLKGVIEQNKLLPPLPALPLEMHTLSKSTEPEDIGVSTGLIRFWIDIVKDEDPYDIINIKTLSRHVDFEMRVVVWNITNISVFKDLGQRNDVEVELRLVTVDFFGKLHTSTKSTDCHKYANKEANFNCRLKFDIHLPVAACWMECSMRDMDTLSGNDVIYEDEILELDDLCRLNLDRSLDGHSPLPILSYKVLFDIPAGGAMSTSNLCSRLTCGMCTCGTKRVPEEVKREMRAKAAEKATNCCSKGCLRYANMCRRYGDVYCRKCCSSGKDIGSAIMNLSVTMITKDIADANPVGEGQDAPNHDPHLPPPEGRVSWRTWLSDPVLMLKKTLGPDAYRCVTVGTFTVLTILLVALILFTIAQVRLALI